MVDCINTGFLIQDGAADRKSELQKRKKERKQQLEQLERLQSRPDPASDPAGSDKSNLQQQVCSLTKGTPQQVKMALRTLLLVGGLLCVVAQAPCESGCLCDTGVAKNVPDLWPHATGVLCGHPAGTWHVRGGVQHLQQRLSKVPVLQSELR
jgi:hypothetical protein